MSTQSMESDGLDGSLIPYLRGLSFPTTLRTEVDLGSRRGTLYVSGCHGMEQRPTSSRSAILRVHFVVDGWISYDTYDRHWPEKISSLWHRTGNMIISSLRELASS